MIHFYLGGSRRMAEKYPDLIFPKWDADYEYNVQHSDEATRLLSLIGEKQKGSMKYNDDQAVDFYILDGGVSVVTRKNLDVYIKAFEMVDPQDYISFLWKSSPGLTQPFSRDLTRQHFNKLFIKAQEGAGDE